jgi:hypothetical protein
LFLFLLTGEISNSEYELTFLASVGGLGLETFYLRQLRSEEEPSDQLSIATLRLFHTDREPFQVYINILSSSVAYPDPNPPDPHVFGPSGSGSISQRYGSGSGSGSFYHHAK